MKRWMYLIFPGAMLGLFLIAYFAEIKKADIAERAHIAEVDRQKKEKEAKEAVLRQKAEADAKKRADDRAAEVKKKEDQRIADQAKADKDIADAIAKSKAEADKSTKAIAQAESDLQAQRTLRDKANREYLELLKNVERARTDRRTAEMKIQEATETIAKRAADSVMAKMPPPPPAAPAKRAS